jgi:exosortase/archaeosortase family protein
MAESNEHNDKKGEPHDTEGSASDRQAARRGSNDSGGRFYTWYASRRPVMRYVIVLTVLVGGFHIYFSLYLSKTEFFSRYLGINADICAAVIRAFGDDATTRGELITSSRFSLQVKAGCDAIQASALFVFMVLASPTRISLKARMLPLLVGTGLLLGLNLTRIISLYYTGVYMPSLFDFMHVDLWQIVFIFTPLLLWGVWARRSIPELRGSGDDSK